jgi:acyl carrier protein
MPRSHALARTISNMTDTNELKARLKALMVEQLMLQVPAAEIADDLPLFGPEGLALDSVDALQLVVVLEKNFGLKIQDTEVARQVMQTVSSMAEAVVKHRQAVGADGHSTGAV